MTSTLPPYVFAPAPNIFNFQPQGAAANLQKWRAALARVRSGTGNATLYCLGDSTTFGEYSNGGADTGDLVSRSYPSQLAARFNGAGLPANPNGFAGGGYQGGSPNRSGCDPRLGFGGGWGVSTGSNVTGGGGFLNLTSQSLTDTLTFTPTVNCDTFKVLYARSLYAGTFNLKINGGTATTVNANAATTGLALATVTATPGANALTINYAGIAGASGTGVYILGIVAFNSATPGVNVINAGWGGSGTGSAAGWTQNANGYDPLPASVAFGQDLTLINLGINDWNNAMPAATYQANLQTIVTRALTVGDVALVTPNPTNSSTAALQQAYVAACYQVAAANNLCLIDNNARFAGYANANALGLMGNSLHPNQNGYADNAAAIARVLIGV